MTENFELPLMNPSQATRLEKSVQENPRDIDSRIKLAHYYVYNVGKNRRLLDRYFRHVHWLIENEPANSYHTSSLADTILCRYAPHLLEPLKLEWFRQVHSYPESVMILSHAAFFCKSVHLRTSAFLWEKALSLDSNNYTLLEGLCLTYTYLSYSGSQERRHYYARKAIETGLQAIAVNDRAMKKSFYSIVMIDQLLQLAEQYNLSDDAKHTLWVACANVSPGA